MTADESFALLQQLFAKKKQIDSAVLSSPSEDFRERALASLERLCALSNFASARDVQTLAKGMLGKLLRTKSAQKGAICLSEHLVVEEIDSMVQERTQRAKAAGSKDHIDAMPMQQAPRTKEQQPPTSKTATAVAHNAATAQEKEQHPGAEEAIPLPEDDASDPDGNGCCKLAVRDAGVSDAVWNQLQQDRLKEEEEAREVIRLREEEARLKEWLKKCADAKRQRELEAIERKRRELEEKRKREEMMKEKLMQMGRCPVGYAWIKQEGGYRCAGGSHYMSDGEVEGL